jgi:hypothetical protein
MSSLLVHNVRDSDLIAVPRVGDCRRFFDLDAFGLPPIGSDRFRVKCSLNDRPANGRKVRVVPRVRDCFGLFNFDAFCLSPIDRPSLRLMSKPNGLLANQRARRFLAAQLTLV